jgi:hypothetical protein
MRHLARLAQSPARQRPLLYSRSLRLRELLAAQRGTQPEDAAVARPATGAAGRLMRDWRRLVAAALRRRLRLGRGASA